jgi:hypothetical protein
MRIKSVIAMISLAILPLTTRAEILTYEFTATIGSMFEHDAQTKINTNVSTSAMPGSNFSIGEFIVGQFSYDLAAITTSSDSSGTDGNLVFGAAVKNFSFLIPATGFKYESEMGASGNAVFSDSTINPSGWDNFSPFSTAAYNTSIFQSANINLFDKTGTAFTGYSLPSSLSLSSFHYTNLHFAWLRKADGDQFHFNGPLQSLSLVTAVPLPGVLALFSSGLALVLAPSLRRRSQRRARSSY